MVTQLLMVLKKRLLFTMPYFIIVVVLQCGNPYYIRYTLDFHFQTDLLTLGLYNLNIRISAQNKTEAIIIDSSDFFTCPVGNDTCDRRTFYNEVPGYTQTVPMTSHQSKEYDLLESDGDATMTVSLIDSPDTLLNNSFNFDAIKKYDFFLIYLGYSFDVNKPKIGNFYKCLTSGTHNKLTYKPFPINGTKEENDSLYLIWVE